MNTFITTLHKITVLLFLSLTCTNAFSTELQDRIENPIEITLDLSKTETIELDEVLPGDYKFTILNLLPSQREKYKISINKENLFPDAFDKPESLKQEKGDKKDKSTESSPQSAPFCEDVKPRINKLADQIYKLDYEAAVSIYMKKLSVIRNMIPDNNTLPINCIEVLATIEKIESHTRFAQTATFKNKQKLTLTVVRDKKTIQSLTLKNEPTEWLTHVGFTFLNNKNKHYFSQKIAGENEGDKPTYLIAKGQQRDNISYAATAMFTYPFIQDVWGGDFDFGFSVGLGTDKDSIAALVGLSMVINDNFMATIGVIGSQFDVLKGEYVVGQELGETPLDSSNLVEKTYNFPLMLTLSYKFGSE